VLNKAPFVLHVSIAANVDHLDAVLHQHSRHQQPAMAVFGVLLGAEDCNAHPPHPVMEPA
jgi:hypothetical protein